MIAFAVTLVVSFVVLFRLFFAPSRARRPGRLNRARLCRRAYHSPHVDWGIAMADVTAEFFDRLAERGT